MFKVFNVVLAVTQLSQNMFRNKIALPLAKLIDDTFDIFRSKTRAGIVTTKDVIFKGSIMAFIVSLLVCLSVFMYLAFYFTYVPAVQHERPVHLKFKVTEGEQTARSYLSAHVELSKNQQLLMLGQPYQIYLDLELPESVANRELGMFMVCATFNGKDHQLITQSCRSSMLHYRSPLLDIIYTLFYSPWYVLGIREEKQTLRIEIFSNYEEQQGPTVSDVFIEIQSREIEVYSARFQITAKFSGLRYFMFNWPLISAALGISANIFFIAIVGIVSWYQLIHSDDYRRYVDQRNTGAKEDDDYSYSSSSIEDIPKSDNEAVEDVSAD